ncbi:MAG TPA: hypothetical protein VFM31_03560 [Nitrososphaeraceae archaeon]|jgi:hypothetical protein|nr:hypothetical protein [Nitrososphaeraceae archaeon]
MFNLFKNEHSTIALKLIVVIAGIIFFIAETSIYNDLNIDFAFANINNNNSSSSLNLLNESYTIIEQKTVMSQPAPVRHPGQPSHEVVFALPLRDDGRIWSGTVTFTASKPIEAEILHFYSPEKKIDSIHGEPYHAILPGNKSIAITHLRDLIDVPIEINGIGISSGSFNFVGNALVFHKTNGEPFTVTYTIDAKVKNIGNNK